MGMTQRSRTGTTWRGVTAMASASSKGGRGLGALPGAVRGSATDFTASEVSSAGGDSTGTLTLSEAEGVLSVALGEGLFAIAPGTLDFQPVSNAAAVVAPVSLMACPSCPCATSTAAEGALALDGNQLVLSILGEGCGTPIAGFVQCPLPSHPTGELSGPELCEDTDAGPPAFAGGAYGNCTTTLPGEGSVTVSMSQGLWTATLSGLNGIATVGPGLTLPASNAGAAFVAPGQQLSVEESGWGPSRSSGPPPNDAAAHRDPAT